MFNDDQARKELMRRLTNVVVVTFLTLSPTLSVMYDLDLDHSFQVRCTPCRMRYSRNEVAFKYE